MASPLTVYEGPGEIQLGSKTLAEATSVRITIAPNAASVVTMKKGMAGFSDGAVSCTLAVESAVPKAGLEVDFIDLCINLRPVTVSVLFAGKRYSFDGKVTDLSTSNAVGSAASASFTVTTGRPRVS